MSVRVAGITSRIEGSLGNNAVHNYRVLSAPKIAWKALRLNPSDNLHRCNVAIGRQ